MSIERNVVRASKATKPTRKEQSPRIKPAIGIRDRDVLAKAYLALLIERAGAPRRPHRKAPRRGGSDPVDALLDDLEDGTAPSVARLRPDVALAAVQVARSIADEAGLAKLLRQGCPVISVAVHRSEMVSSVRDVIETCVLSRDRVVQYEGRRVQPGLDEVLIVSRDGTGKDHKPDVGNDGVGVALYHGAAVIGIAPDPIRQLPRDLMRMADYNLELPEIDNSALSIVIDAVIGSPPTKVIDNHVLGLLDHSDLMLGFRGCQSADDWIDSLERIAVAKSENHSKGPRLEELSGYGAAKEWGLALAADLREFRTGKLKWHDVDNRGLLLSGPPGVGKTSFARALAKTASVPLIATSVAAWNQATYLSGTLQAMEEAFAKAKRAAPSILFIDELDGISDRAKLRGEHVEYWSQVVNRLLELLQGVDEREGVVVIGATNFPENIDAAVKRAGRLDHEIRIEKPDSQGLRQIIRHHLGSQLPDVDLSPVALASVGMTGADVESFVRRARGAARRARRAMDLSDLVQAAMAGKFDMPDNGRRICAIHEAGHVVAALTLGCAEVMGASLKAGGGATHLKDITQTATSAQLDDMVVLLMSGRAAEKLLMGAVTIGSGGRAGSDLDLATKLARDIELRFGFGKAGPIYLEGKTTEELLQVPWLFAAISDRLKAAELRAGELLAKHKDIVVSISDALAETGYLSAQRIREIMSGSADRSSKVGVEEPPANMGEAA